MKRYYDVELIILWGEKIRSSYIHHIYIIYKKFRNLICINSLNSPNYSQDCTNKSLLALGHSDLQVVSTGAFSSRFVEVLKGIGKKINFSPKVFKFNRVFCSSLNLTTSILLNGKLCNHQISSKKAHLDAPLRETSQNITELLNRWENIQNEGQKVLVVIH